MTAPNLGNKGLGRVRPAKCKLAEELGHPAHVVNDADMAGLGVVSGTGLEMVITLGTGFRHRLYYRMAYCCPTFGSIAPSRGQRAWIMMSILAIKRWMT
jgi:hypothetical protein